MKYFFSSLLGFALVLFLSCANNSPLEYPDIKYGSMTDGEQKYKTVEIGEQTWMAENLNKEVTGSKCYNDSIAYCKKYGRLYDWKTAMALPDSCNSSFCSEQIDEKHQGICPNGWHLPSKDEWEILIDVVGSPTGTRLKATSGWNDNYNGTNAFGFAAMPGGRKKDDGFSDIGDYGGWWSSYEYGDGYIYVQYIYSSNDEVSDGRYEKPYLFSVRCLKNKD